jgi:alkylation response protein AidB-like acyl-CoA dehydrogenase
MDSNTVLSQVAEVATRFAKERAERQRRRQLERADFQALADAGFLLTGVSREQGGLWSDLQSSTRPVSDMLRVIARADPSVALVASMHPAVLSFWLALGDAPEPYAAAFAEQKRFVAQTALEGHFWGTITSEPGSGGDVAKSRALAAPVADGYALSGQKHFGSGSGIASYMVTTALPQGESDADWFYLDLRNVPWDGSRGVKLISEWDGQGMTATQSHAFAFERFAATRMAWPGNLLVVSGAAGAFVSTLFAAVIVGVVETAIAQAREVLRKRVNELRPYERVEWVRAENEAWLIGQAFEGMRCAVESKGAGAGLDALRGKECIAELAECMTARLCKVLGGGTFHRASPFGSYFEDVRALGFLRPPWGLAFDQLFERGFSE